MGTSSEHTAPVGRAEQIRALDVLLGVVAREADEDAPRIRSLLIGGDAGIGKTTLVESLAERCREMGLRCAVGHCLDLATGLPFGPVVEALHWADAPVRDFALAALRTCRAPLLLVLTFRADEVTSGHPLRLPLVEL